MCGRHRSRLVRLRNIDIWTPPWWHITSSSPAFSPPIFVSTWKDECVNQTRLIYWLSLYPAVIYLPYAHSLSSVPPFILPFHSLFSPPAPPPPSPRSFSQEVDAPDRCWSVWSGQASRGAGPPATPRWTHYVWACPRRTRTPCEWEDIMRKGAGDGDKEGGDTWIKTNERGIVRKTFKVESRGVRERWLNKITFYDSLNYNLQHWGYVMFPLFVCVFVY